MEDVRDRATACKAEIVAASIAVVSAPTHDRAWWIGEAGRVGSDWAGIVESHLAVLAKLGLIERGSRQ
jgi:hypothetical protein